MQTVGVQVNGVPIAPPPPPPPIELPVCITQSDPVTEDFCLDDYYHPCDLSAVQADIDAYALRSATYDRADDELKATLRELAELEKKTSTLKRHREAVERERNEERMINMLRSSWIIQMRAKEAVSLSGSTNAVLVPTSNANAPRASRLQEAAAHLAARAMMPPPPAQAPPPSKKNKTSTAAPQLSKSSA